MPPLERFFIDAPLKKGAELALETAEFHHLSKVLRKKAGEVIEIVNGKGFLARARLQKLLPNSALLIAEELFEEKPSLPPRILIQALPRISHLDLIIEKGVELGLSEFRLFPSSLSERKELSLHQLQRLKQIAISALKQCKRLDLPKILWKNSLQECLMDGEKAFFGDLRKEAPFLSINEKERSQPLCFFIGPEKGFSKEELQILEETLRAKGIRLGPYVLRAETAAIAASALFALL